MKIVLLLLFLCVLSKANNSFYNVICNESVESGLYFERVFDVRGRFMLKWCTLANKKITKWALHLYYYTSLKPEQCNKDFIDSNYIKSPFHSVFDEPVQVNFNCTNVCFTATLDAIFSFTCYRIDTQLSEVVTENGVTIITKRNSYNQYHYVRETNFTQDFTEIEARANDMIYEEGVILYWHPGIPASQYVVTLRRNNTDDKVDMNCSTETPQRVVCRARASAGCYTAEFRHEAPWTSLNLLARSINFHHNFCYDDTKPPMATDGRPWWMWWVAGSVGGALLLGVLLLLLLRRQHDGELKQNILRSWVDEIRRRMASRGAARAAERVVLLYARDCAHMERAAQHLAALLHHATGCEVVDLYKPETVSASAPSAAAWLRALLLRAGTRVLLVQSPATALYCARLAHGADGSPTLEAPLLGSRVAWRRPHAADAQLLLALRLLTDAAHRDPLPYKKYYVATVAGLQHDDAVPALTPQRRFLLPDGAEELLRHLAPGPPGDPPPDPADPPPDPAAAHHLRQLAEALEEFRVYALANPDYLFNDLVLE